MNYKDMIIGTFAIMVSYLIFTIPFVTATSINIVFNGQVEETVELSARDLINKDIRIKHDTSDITWTNVKLVVNVNSASLAHTVQRIYLFKCGDLDPVDCSRLSPQTFDNWVDTELLWNDISEKTTAAPYPEIANMLFLVKMEGLDKRTNWAAYWHKVERTDYNAFNQYSFEIGKMDVYAKSADFIQPIKTYIENYKMIPFNWLTKTVFRTAESLFSIGGDTGEIETPILHSAHPSGDEIDAINKDFFLIFPETSSGITDAITLNLNPSFTCGDSICESNLGESSQNCCYDCDCIGDYYCDVPGEPITGICKNSEEIDLQITGVTTPEITDCSKPSEVKISTKILNPPSTIPEQLIGRIALNDTFYSITCPSEQPSMYTCPIEIMSNKECGAGSYQIGPNQINYTLTYTDGPNQASKELSKAVPNTLVKYDCSCGDGFYCDIDRGCFPEASVSLSILWVTSFIENYNTAGDLVNLTARINNAPSDLTVIGSSFRLNGTSGSVTCDRFDDHLYNCSLPFNIHDYNHSLQYILYNNSLTFTTTFSSGPVTVTRDISSGFSDVTIPSYRCGDGTCNVEESSESCCSDCGCFQEGTYCDIERGCENENEISLEIDNVYPTEFYDCQVPHVVNITARINNAPTGSMLSYYYYINNDQISGWNTQCRLRNPGLSDGLIDCEIIIPPITGCELPYYDISPNELNVTISFFNGTRGIVTKSISDDFQILKVIPTYHCGDGNPELEFGENGKNCCIDVPCETDPDFGAEYYCDYNPEVLSNGTCKLKSDIRLVVDSPKATVNFDCCEKRNYINVKTHIENPPSGMKVGHFFAQLNGSDSMIRCEPEMEFLGIINYSSWNCTITIPRLLDCHKGDTYKYTPNKIGARIGYPDGHGISTAVIESKFADAVITQNLRTMKDIVDDAILKIKDEMATALDLVEEMSDKIQDCMEIMYILALVGMVASVSYLIPGFRGWAFDSQEFDAKQLGAIGQTTSLLAQMFGNMCNLLRDQYELELKKVEMNKEIIKMEMCIEIAQHDMDGCCQGDAQTPDQSWSSFGQMSQCITEGWGAMENSMDDMMGIMDNSIEHSSGIGDAWFEIGDLWDEVGLFGNADDDYEIRVYPENWQTPSTQICSAKEHYTGDSKITVPPGTDRAERIPTQCGYTNIRLEGRDVKRRCKHKLYLFKDTGSDLYEIGEGQAGGVKATIGFYELFQGMLSPQSTVGESGSMGIGLCCDYNDDSECESREVVIQNMAIMGMQGYDASREPGKSWDLSKHCTCDGVAGPEAAAAKRAAQSPGPEVEFSIIDDHGATWTKKSGASPLEITWNIKVMQRGDDEITDIRLMYGDGAKERYDKSEISSGIFHKIQKHEYIGTKGQKFKAVLSAMDIHGRSTVMETEISILGDVLDDDAVTVSIKGDDGSYVIGDILIFETDPTAGKTPFKYSWTCGAGSTKIGDCIGDECKCKLESKGNVRVSVLVTDSDGDPSTVGRGSKDITVSEIKFEIKATDNPLPHDPPIGDDGYLAGRDKVTVQVRPIGNLPDGTYSYDWYCKGDRSDKKTQTGIATDRSERKCEYQNTDITGASQQFFIHVEVKDDTDKLVGTAKTAVPVLVYKQEAGDRISIRADKTSIRAGESVELTPDADITNLDRPYIMWHCDNGETPERKSKTDTIRCTYPTPGTFKPYAELMESGGNLIATSDKKLTITVTDNPPPTISVKVPSDGPGGSVYVNSKLTCTVTATDDDTPLTYDYWWYYGDKGNSQDKLLHKREKKGSSNVLDLSEETMTYDKYVTCYATAKDNLGAVSEKKGWRRKIQNTKPTMRVEPTSVNEDEDFDLNVRVTDIDSEITNVGITITFNNRWSGDTVIDSVLNCDESVSDDGSYCKCVDDEKHSCYAVFPNQHQDVPGTYPGTAKATTDGVDYIEIVSVKIVNIS